MTIVVANLINHENSDSHRQEKYTKMCLPNEEIVSPVGVRDKIPDQDTRLPDLDWMAFQNSILDEIF